MNTCVSLCLCVRMNTCVSLCLCVRMNTCMSLCLCVENEYMRVTVFMCKNEYMRVTVFMCKNEYMRVTVFKCKNEFMRVTVFMCKNEYMRVTVCVLPGIAHIQRGETLNQSENYIFCSYYCRESDCFGRLVLIVQCRHWRQASLTNELISAWVAPGLWIRQSTTDHLPLVYNHLPMPQCSKHQFNKVLKNTKLLVCSNYACRAKHKVACFVRPTSINLATLFFQLCLQLRHRWLGRGRRSFALGWTRPLWPE